jgi:3-hydroxyacyl-[acyl-carrier-protein] dehydratase
MVPPESDIAGEIFFDPQDSIYPDHFPGHPVVPGSLIIEAFIRVVGPILKDNQKSWVVENFRFRHFISPGRYAFRVSGKADGPMQCMLYDGSRVVATGILSSSDFSH